MHDVVDGDATNQGVPVDGASNWYRRSANASASTGHGVWTVDTSAWSLTTTAPAAGRVPVVPKTSNNNNNSSSGRQAEAGGCRNGALFVSDWYKSRKNRKPD